MTSSTKRLKRSETMKMITPNKLDLNLDKKENTPSTLGGSVNTRSGKKRLNDLLATFQLTKEITANEERDAKNQRQ